MPPSITGHRAKVAIFSLVIGPSLMSVGDLFHPAESHDIAEQASIILANPAPWFYAHLLLFFGMLIYMPGLLALSELVAKKSPTAGYISRILLIVGASSFAGVFVGEMLLGRYAMDGADLAAETALVASVGNTLLSGPALVGALTFVGGVGLVAERLARVGGNQRWGGLVLALGLTLILVEIASANVLFSKIGNLAILAASTIFAWHILRTKGASATSVGDDGAAS